MADLSQIPTDQLLDMLHGHADPAPAAPSQSSSSFWDIASRIGAPSGIVGAQEQQGALGGLKSLAMGARDPLDAAAQMGARAGADNLPQGSAAQQFFQSQVSSVEQARKQAESSYNQDNPGAQMQFDPLRAIGNVAATAPIAYALPGAGAQSAIARILSGAVSGGAVNTLQPEADAASPDFWSQKASQGKLGAAMGAVAPAIGSVVGGLIGPKGGAATQTLADAGVTMTPGQRAGGVLNSVEQKLQSLPLVGERIQSARASAISDFNRATINQALSPIGETLEKGTPLGREAIDEMSQKVSGAYDKILPKVTVQQTPEFAKSMGQLHSMANSGLLPERAKQFENILQDKLYSKFSPGGGMTGEGWKGAESELGRVARGYRSSPDMDQRQLGDALLQAQANLRSLLVANNPAQADEIKAANSAYAMSRRVSDASSRIGAAEGVFTPNQFLSAVRAQDPTQGKTQFARGNALMQDWADAGKSVLGNTVPDSGTAGRSALWEVPAALGGLYAFHPGAAAAAAAGGVGLMGMYSRPWLRAAPTIAEGLRRGGSLLGPYAGAAASGLLSGP